MGRQSGWAIRLTNYLPSTVNIKKKFRYNSTPPYAFMEFKGEYAVAQLVEALC